MAEEARVQLQLAEGVIEPCIRQQPHPALWLSLCAQLRAWLEAVIDGTEDVESKEQWLREGKRVLTVELNEEQEDLSGFMQEVDEGQATMVMTAEILEEPRVTPHGS